MTSEAGQELRWVLHGQRIIHDRENPSSQLKADSTIEAKALVNLLNAQAVEIVQKVAHISRLELDAASDKAEIAQLRASLQQTDQVGEQHKRAARIWKAEARALGSTAIGFELPDEAEAEMMRTGTLEGAHHRGIEAELRALTTVKTDALPATRPEA